MRQRIDCKMLGCRNAEFWGGWCKTHYAERQTDVLPWPEDEVESQPTPDTKGVPHDPGRSR